MSLPSSDDPKQPWWYLIGVAVFGLLGIGSRIYFNYRAKKLSQTNAEEQTAIDRQTQVRREAAVEAWEVVDRLQTMMQEVKSENDKRFQDLETRCDKVVDEAQ